MINESGAPVGNNLGPTLLAGPEALDPNYYGQPTLEVLTVHGNGISSTHTIYDAHLI